MKLIQYHCIKCRTVYFGYKKLFPKCPNCKSVEVIKIKL